MLHCMPLLRPCNTDDCALREPSKYTSQIEDRRYLPFDERKDKGKKQSRFLGFGGARDDGVDVDGKKAPVAGPRRLVHVGVP